MLKLLVLLIISNPGLHKLKLMLDWFPNADHVPLYVAKEAGIFKKHGLDVQILVPSETSDPLKIVAASKVDVVINYEPQVVIARSQGLPVVSIGVLVEHPLITVLFLKGKGIEKPQDLSNRTIGYAVPFLQEILFKAFAEKNGIKGYKLINVGFNITPSLLTGKVDAVIGAYRNYEKNEIELEGKEPGYFALENYGLPDFYELVIVTSDKTLESRKEDLVEFIKAIDEAIKFTRENPEKALALYFKANPDVRKDLDKKAFYDTLPLYAHSQVQSEKVWKDFIDFAIKYGLIKKRPEGKVFVNLVD